MKQYSYKDYTAENDCDNWKFNMYQLTSPPPKIRNTNDYIIDYKQTGNIGSLQLYLHFFEPALNQITYDYCIKYTLLHRFQEIKQVIVESMLESLPDYNPDIGATLQQYTVLYVRDQVRNFIHENGSMYKLGNSPNEYRALRKVNAIYYNLDLTEHEKILEIERQTGFDREKIIDLLRQGSDFRQFISLDQAILTTDEDEQVLLSETIADNLCDPQVLYPKQVFKQKFYDVLNQLTDEERYLFIETNGFCMNCLSELPPHKRKTYHDISAELLLHSESAVQQRIRKIGKFLQKELINEKVVQACAIRFMGTEDIEDGLIRFRYAYRNVLCKGEGVIDNIYDTNAKRFWGADVLYFAEGDNRNCFPVAKLAIRAVNCRLKTETTDTVIVEKLW